MEHDPTLLEGLIDKAEAYGKTTLKLTTYKAVGLTADITSGVVSKLVFTVIFLMIFTLASIGMALWLGQQLGAAFYGFFALAGLYLVVGLLVYLFRQALIKTPVSDAVISKLQD